ncbi:hypothetical protein [Clostridium botulinum]|uniref:hypothetical protein n=1 Tax=Clostridium botulinum TaxID=1491 RepID=UPI00096FD3BA|nr:hypothetical protein [Clostridium botulinum]NFD57280.1 hypothetical protein [Clostridium botulinum]
MIDNSIELNIKAFYGSNRYKLRFWYKGDLYETIYGYSVDLDIIYGIIYKIGIKLGWKNV